MTVGFFRYPRTPHLAWLGSEAPRDDKVLSRAEAEELLRGEVVVEEKVDGANLGLSLDDNHALRAQNRGRYLAKPYGGQFTRLAGWLTMHDSQLSAALGPKLIAFGEWCAARHSLEYDRLPDWWLAFDVYDRSTKAFLPAAERDSWLSAAGVVGVARLYRGRVSLDRLQRLLTDEPSQYRAGPMEGLVIRREQAEVTWSRAKLVRPEFVQAIDDHWSRRRIDWNRIDPAATQA
jgi:hypothetical protein